MMALCDLIWRRGSSHVPPILRRDRTLAFYGFTA